LRGLLFPTGGDALTVPVMAAGTNTTIVVPSLGSITLFVPNITIMGLDTFTDIQLLHAAEGLANSATLRTELALASLNISVNMELWVNPFQIITGQVLFEQFQLNLSLASPTLILDLELAIKEDAFNALHLGQILPDPYKLPNGNGMACLMSTFFSANASQLYLNTTLPDIGLYSFNDAAPLEHSLDVLLDQLVKLPLLHFAPLVSRVVGAAMNGPVREAFNTQITNSLKASPACPSLPAVNPWNGSVPFDFSSSPLLTVLDLVLDILIGAPGINNILTCIVDQYSASGIVFSLNEGPLNLDIKNVAIANLPSFHNFTVLAPIGHYTIDNQLWFVLFFSPSTECLLFVFVFFSLSHALSYFCTGLVMFLVKPRRSKTPHLDRSRSCWIHHPKVEILRT
jgi:hypothetical protein